MKLKVLLVLILIMFTSMASAIDYTGGDIHEKDFKWMNANLYHGVDQRGGPFKFTDTYLELEFGGRSGVIDYYGYVDFLDILNDSESDRHDGDNSFAKVDLRFSLDAMFKKDLALGAVKEWYIATEYMDGDKGLRVFWVGLGTDIEVPWLGLVGFNVQTRYYMENFGAPNEEKFDGIVAHINWFKPLTFFDKDFIAFQGYMDYEFFSKLNEPESSFYSDDSFQAYLGLWFHSKRYAVGYGAKFYKNMTQFKDGASSKFINGGQKFDTTGLGHYFNVTYKF